MKTSGDPRRLDIRAFARSNGVREQTDTLAEHPRLAAEAAVAAGERPLHWRAHAEERTTPGSSPQAWLHLQADASVPLTCQRCLDPVDVALTVDRWFRFVADEATAEREDEEVEEDLLVLDKAFDLAALVEDELLMELPLVPRHDICPREPEFEVSDPEFERAQQAKTQPFDVLATLKRKPDSSSS